MPIALIRTVTLALLLATPDAAQPAPGDPSAIVERAVTSMSHGPLRYAFHYRGEGAVADALPEARGHVSIEPLAGERLGEYRRARIVGRRGQGRDGAELDLVIRDGTVYTFDRARRLLRRNPAYRVGLDNDDRRLLLPIESLPIWRQVEATLDGSETVAGIVCDVLRATVPGGFEARVFVARRDGLLRRLAMTREDWGGWRGGAAVLDLEPRPASFTDDDFPTALPAGFAVEEYTGAFPAIGAPAPPWTLPSLGGSPVSLGDFRGRVVVLDFFASWCLPCYELAPHLSRLHRRFADRPVAILGVTWQEPAPAAFAERLEVDYPVLIGDTIDTAYNLEESGLPIVYVIDAEGRLFDFFRDKVAIERHLETVIEAALGRSDAR